MNEATVDCLIDAETRQWNSEMVDGIFTPAEAELIKAIPPSRVEAEDSLFWPLSADGHYNCKMGYKFLKEEEEVNIQEPPDDDKQLWKGIWTMEISNKMKILVWRACKNFLPTKGNLVRRTIITYPNCDRCIALTEAPLHIMHLVLHRVR